MNEVKAWFGGLSPRERMLVAIAGVLLAVLAAFLLIVRPILSARSSGIAEYEGATRTYETVLRAAGRPGGSQAPVGSGPLRTIVSETAQASGIVVDRYAIEEDAVDLTIAETDASTLYAWLGALSERHGVVVREGTVRALGESGRVTARLTLGRSG